MKTLPIINKTKHPTTKGRKRYKMEGPKSRQSKNPPKGGTTRGMGTNQVPQKPHSIDVAQIKFLGFEVYKGSSTLSSVSSMEKST